MFNFSVKGFLGYGSPRAFNDGPHRFEREDSPTQSTKRDAEPPEMAEVKRIKLSEQITTAADTREKTSSRERNSMDSRRKDSIKGYISHEAYLAPLPEHEPQVRRYERWEQPLMQVQKPDTERPTGEANRKGKIADPPAKDVRETSSVKERSPTDNRKKEIRGRGRSYSASVQDVSSTRVNSPFVKEGALADIGKREVVRGRASSVVRRDAKSLEFDRVVDDRSIERSRKHRDGSGVRDPILQDIIEHNNSLKRQLETTQDMLRNAEQKKIELHKTMNVLRDEKAQLLEREGAVKREAVTKEKEAQQRTADLLAKTRKQEDEIRQLKERLRQAEEKNSHTTNLLEVRTADLRGAEAFLTTADKYSGADIINMVKSLNAEIFQAAAYMAELLEDPSTVAAEDDRKKNLQKYVRSIEDARLEIGDGLFEYFLDKGVRVRSDPLPLQLALQCLFSRWCAVKTQRFCDIDTFDRNLNSLYQGIQDSEAQAVAGRWRAITYSNIKSLDNQTHADQVLNMAISLLCLCGWSLSSPRSQKAILAMQQVVKVLEKLWLQLKCATKESTIAADFDVFIIDFDRPYDDAKMEDSYCDISTKSSSHTKNGTRVLCSIGVGLQKRVVKRVEGMPLEKQTDLLVKAKVALETVLRDIKDGGDNVSGKLPSPNRSDRWNPLIALLGKDSTCIYAAHRR